MEDETGAASRRPTHALRVAPPLVADGDPERDPIDLEQPAPSVGRVEWFFFEGNLILRLVADDLAVAGDDERDVVEPGGGFPLHADDGRHPMRLRRDADRLQRLLLATLVMVRDRKVEAAQPGEVGLWKTDDSHVEHRGLLQEAFDRLQPLCDRRRVPHGGQTNAQDRVRHERSRFQIRGQGPWWDA